MGKVYEMYAVACDGPISVAHIFGVSKVYTIAGFSPFLHANTHAYNLTKIFLE